MVTRYRHKDLTWVDLTAPTAGEVRALMEEFDLHPLVADELLSESAKQKTERYGNHLYLVLRFPELVGGAIKNDQELDLIAGKNFLITAHYGPIDQLHAIAKSFEMNSLLDHAPAGHHGGHLLYVIVKRLYQGLSDEMEFLHAQLRDIEERIFLGNEHDMVFEISRTSRSVLDFRRALSPHKDLLSSLELSGSRLYGSDFTYYARTLQSENLKVMLALEELRDSMQELRETNNSLLSTKENEIMKTLTMMAFTTFPLALITSIFALDTAYRPIIGMHGDFWIIIGILLALALGFFSYFKYRKWI